MRSFAIFAAVLAIAELALGEENNSKNEVAPNDVADPAHPEVTPAPEIPLELRGLIEPRVTFGPDVIGFFSWFGSWETASCSSSETYGADATYGACCATTSNCVWATACEGNTVMFNNGGSGACGNGGFCDTITIINSPGPNLPMTGVRSLIQCFGSSGFYDYPRTYYRVEFALTSSISTPTKTATATVTQTLKSTVTVNAAPATVSRAGDLTMLWVCLVPLLMSAFGLVFVV